MTVEDKQRMSEPTLKMIKNIIHKKSVITIYEASNGDVVLGGFGWYERFDWEEINWRDISIITYECGHESEMLALDGSPTMLSAYLRWSEGVETYGDKSMCFKCWYDSSVSSKIGEKNE